MEPKTIVITGASSGIGAETARMSGKQGHRLVLSARREKELQEVAAEAGSEAITVLADVTRRADLERLRDAAIKEFGHIDVWINNAGRGISKVTLELTDADFDEMINVNLRSVLYGMQVVVPHFQERKRGHLINVSSFLGRVPLVTFRSVYSAAKAAMNSLTANVRMDLAVDYPDIHVSTFFPARVLTDFHDRALGGAPKVTVPAGATQAQTVEEVAQALVALIDNPQPEVYTNPMLAEFARQYYADVSAFEERLRQQ